jgi:hypothetical protein
MYPFIVTRVPWMASQLQNLCLLPGVFGFLVIFTPEHCRATLTAREKMIIAGGVAVTVVVGGGFYYLARNNNTLSDQGRQEFKIMNGQHQRLENVVERQSMDNQAGQKQSEQTTILRKFFHGIISFFPKDSIIKLALELDEDIKKNKRKINELSQSIKELKDRKRVVQRNMRGEQGG